MLSVLLSIAARLPGTTAEIRWGGQSLAGFRAFQCLAGADDGYYVTMHVRLEDNCAVNADSIAQAARSRADVAAVVVWEEAVAAGCFSFAQVTRRLVAASATANVSIRAAVFGSAVSAEGVPFGSPIVEPYDDLQSAGAGLLVMLTASSAAHSLARGQPGYVFLRSEPGPWNGLVDTAGFRGHKYLFLAISILLILYTFWEIGLMLCALTVWNWRMLMYLSAIGYLVVFTLLQPYSMNSRAAVMTIHISWIVGYVSLTLFIVAWGAMLCR
ncbi:hypothetical protein LPJ61_000360 [Coemansia biformis]|uniref:Uncharacterized protein n=1 Tax=Coemansia biformis TaxID=1286918 RepID=A0A9W7YJS1_9FUNG|nr:hypothetical protein LPJ61_000360 [Coemansia biformis]